MRLPVTLSRGAQDEVRIARDPHGVPHVMGRSEPALHRGLGYCHAIDRPLQMLLVRVLAQGRASELLISNEELEAADRFFRRLNLSSGAAAEVDRLAPEDQVLAQAYCEGVNLALRQRVPWELRLLGYSPAPWRIADCILISRLVGYVALAQSQEDMERFLVELIQAGLPQERLEELFPGVTRELDLDLIKKVRLGERIVPALLRSSAVLPRALASNNWVVSGIRTASGSPILANDPHLEANRLPAVWYEVVLERGKHFCIAATMPGLPGLLVGRTNELAWGATYAFMDAVDSWVEDCRDGCYRRRHGGTDVWEPFRVRREVIRRKRKPETVLIFYENDHGVLDGDPHEAGLYLASRWSVAVGTGAASLSASFGMFNASDVLSGMDLLGQIETSWNWVLADRQGNIGYQMSGRMPVRRPGWSGLAPVPGWDPANNWRGFVEPRRLPRAFNPERGFLATANNDLNRLGECQPINLPMGPYRAERIESVLAARDRWTVDETRALQLDLYSPQAERFMAILRPLLPPSPEARPLLEWDCKYDLNSRGAYLFEGFYRELFREVFSRLGSTEIADFISRETPIIADFYYNFDRILLQPQSAWFGSESREEIYERVAKRALCEPARTWGSAHQLAMRHLLLGGKLPAWCGFDAGPVPLPGSRATVRQGQIYRAGGRQTSFAPSYRLVTDLSQDSAHTSLAGGPSDRRFSRWYTHGLEDWIAGRLKRLEPMSGR